MTHWLSKLASLRFTLVGIGGLLVFVLLTYRSGGAALMWLLLPLCALSANLVAALLCNRAFRLQTALLSFHIGLLIVFLLVCGGLLTHLQGRIELVEGEQFDADRVEIVSSGLLHRNKLKDVRFRQETVEVQYVAGLQRGMTRSRVVRQRPDGPEESMLTGDGRSLTAGGYRFRPTVNKGFALLLEWRGTDGTIGLGAINFPSFPEFEWMQRNTWATPAGETIDIELLFVERVPDADAWTLRSAGQAFSVTVAADSRSPVQLYSGDSMEVSGGTLRVSGLRLWLGYRVDSNPFLPWILAAALFSVISLGAHFHLKFRPGPASATVTSLPGGQVA